MFESTGEVVDLDSLQAQLGVFGFQWLCACAVFPVLRYPLTIHLGRKLAEITKRRLDPNSRAISYPDADEHGALFQLSWFRQGWIPADDRARLVAAIPRSLRGKLRKRIDALLFGWRLDTETSGEGAALALAGQAAELRKGVLRSLADGDLMFAEFILGGARPARGMVVGRWLARLLRLRATVYLWIREILWAVIIAAVVMGLVAVAYHEIRPNWFDRVSVRPRPITKAASSAAPATPRNAEPQVRKPSDTPAAPPKEGPVAAPRLPPPPNKPVAPEEPPRTSKPVALDLSPPPAYIDNTPPASGDQQSVVVNAPPSTADGETVSQGADVATRAGQAGGSTAAQVAGPAGVGPSVTLPSPDSGKRENWIVTTAVSDGNISVRGIDFSPDGTKFTTAGSELRVWDAFTGKSVGGTGDTPDIKFGAKFLHNGSDIVYNDFFGSIFIYNTNSHNIDKIYSTVKNDGENRRFDISPDQRVLYIYSSSSNDDAKLFNLKQTSSGSLSIEGNGSTFKSRVIPRFIANTDCVAFIAEGRSNTILKKCLGPPDAVLWKDTLLGGQIKSIALTKDGQWLAAGFDDGKLIISQFNSGNVVNSTPCSKAEIVDIAFSNSMERVVWLDDVGTLCVAATKTGKVVFSTSLGKPTFGIVEFSPDDARILIGLGDLGAKMLSYDFSATAPSPVATPRRGAVEPQGAAFGQTSMVKP